MQVKRFNLQMTEGNVSVSSNYAYLFEWHEYYTPKALYHILSKGIRAKVAKSSFELNGKTYDYGTIMVPVVGQNKSKEELFELMKEVAKPLIFQLMEYQQDSLQELI